MHLARQLLMLENLNIHSEAAEVKACHVGRTINCQQMEPEGPQLSW